jgi:hypothetical protein
MPVGGKCFNHKPSYPTASYESDRDVRVVMLVENRRNYYSIARSLTLYITYALLVGHIM